MPREIDGKTYLTLDEAAHRLGVSSRTVKNWLNRSVVPKPPRASQGLRTFFCFTDEWLAEARRAIEAYRRQRDVPELPASTPD